ncbi:MAG: PepSY domain-containing protein, partial [Bacteroidota bacterium]
IFESIRPERALEMNENAPFSQNRSVNDLLHLVEKNYPDFEVQNVVMLNYGREDATATFSVDDGKGIVGDGLFTYRMKTSELIAKIVPNQKTYSQTIYNLLTKLHFGTFGGILLKIVYFILSMITCFMLISGVLIWQTARNNSQYTIKQKRFHHRTTKVYLAICLSLFPAIALIFIANKLVPLEVSGRATIVNYIFFIGWLVLILGGLFWNNFGKLNRNYLFIGGILSSLVPLLNGIVTGDWIWVSFQKNLYQVASIDLVWLLTGVVSLSLVPILSKKYKLSKSKPVLTV